MSLLCTLGLHRWGPWEITKRGEVTAPSKSSPGRQRIIGETIIQERQREQCSLVEIKDQHVDFIS
jgi:hypothetical protein